MFCVNFFDVSDQNEQREKIIAKDEHEMKNIFAFQLRSQPSCIKKKNSSNGEHSHVMFQYLRAEFGRRGRRRGRPQKL